MPKYRYVFKKDGKKFEALVKAPNKHAARAALINKGYKIK